MIDHSHDRARNQVLGPRLTRRSVALGLAASALGPARAIAADTPADRLRQIIGGRHRTAENMVRDQFRRPFEVITFLDIRPDSKVVEISPGAAGYWTEILAPYLKERGLYVAANPAPQSPAAKAGVDRFNTLFADKMAADPASFSKVQVIDFAPERIDFAPPGAADFVLTFRNLHNWMDRGVVDLAITSFHRALKRGGILGIEEHRGRPDQTQEAQSKTGYVRQDYATALIEKAGFKLAGSSDVLANPKDTKDHPAGVWTLPPTFRLKEQDKDKYAAIGESDRFMLKFVKT